MQGMRKLATALLLVGLAGVAFAAADQTQPGASHGPSSAQNAQNAAGITPNSGHGSGASAGPPDGSSNGISGAAAGASPSSGAMQPRVGGGESLNRGTNRSTTNGGAQGW